MHGSIQSGTAQVLTFTGSALALEYNNAISLTITCRTHAVWMAFSESALQHDGMRMKVMKENVTAADAPYHITLSFSMPRTGLLYFASTDAANTASVTLLQI